MKERKGREREGERWWRGYGTGDKDTHCEAWLPESCLFLFCFVLRQSLLCLRLVLNFYIVEDDLELLSSFWLHLWCWDYRPVGMFYAVLWTESRALCLVGKFSTTEVFL